AGNGSIDSDFPVTTNRWYHLAVTFDGAAYTMYMDGIDVGTVNGPVNAPVAAAANVECLIGAVDSANGFTNNATNFYHGWMDELSIWNVALTPDQIRQMMNQEIEDNGGAVRGVVVPLDVPGITWANLDGYYRMNVVCGNFSPYKGIAGRLRNINSSMPQTAPIPYTSRVDGQLWATDNTWTHFDVWDPPNSLGIDGTTPIDWNIAVISHDIDSGDKDITVLGLLSDTADKKLSITDPGTPQDETNDGQALRITHYLLLDGIIDLYGEAQLLQDQNSVLDPVSTGGLERDQQGTTNLYNYNYWSSPVSVSNGVSINNDYSVGAVLLDGTNSGNPLGLQWTSSYDANPATTPITLSRRWLWVYENYPENTYADWRYLTETGTLPVGLGFTLKGSGVGDPIDDVQNYVFRGLPNNGAISNPITIGNQALIGNPYPSVIFADEFIKDNTFNFPGSTESIDGTLYYWEHYESNFTHILEEYEGGYATYNLTGGVGAVMPDLISGLGSSTKEPGKYIPVAQGFFVTSSPIGGTITFFNDQRVFVREATGTSVFMEANNQQMTFNSERARAGTSEESSTGTQDSIQRIRLDFIAPNGSIRHLLLGFIPGNAATDGFDYGYDAAMSDSFPNDAAWLIDGEEYVIQGVGDFDNSKQYPLAVHVTTSGNIGFALAGLENFDITPDIFIYDSLFDTYFQIDDATSYSMALDPGDYMDRFFIAFDAQGNLDLDEFNNLNVLLNYLQDSNELYLYHPEIQKINSIEIFNLMGQEILVFNKEDLLYSSSAEIRIPIKDIAEGTYVVKVKSDKGTLNRKVIIAY
ncbi:MAG: T9SS type A sorting domain-containing protein, partial [Flavobacteriaceae bacterium]|nr:T9SS type A sorting domain-containing protein [Flavobacteriaceae bacterium]